VAFAAQAEWGCFIELGWPTPARVVDLYAEARLASNDTSPKPDKFNGLLQVLSRYGIREFTKEAGGVKNDMRERILAGAPFSEADQRDIIAYCRTDVEPLPELFGAMCNRHRILDRDVPGIMQRPKGFGQALWRGRYTATAAHIEAVGIPFDTPMAVKMKKHWPQVRLEMIREIDKDFGVFDEGGSLRNDLLERFIRRGGYRWPVTEKSGNYCTDEETLERMAYLNPELKPLAVLIPTLNRLKNWTLHVGPDSRHRMGGLWPFTALTSRNAPSRFVFNYPEWLRGLIVPGPELAIVARDWKSQEVFIAAVKSGDDALLRLAGAADVYLARAAAVGWLEAGAVRDGSDRVEGIRDLFKIVTLATQYGQQERGLARSTGMDVRAARTILRRSAEEFPAYTNWIDQVVNKALLTGGLTSALGWQMLTVRTTRPNTCRNFLMQSTGAEMMRAACNLAVDRGIQVCCPVHDSLIAVGPADEIGAVSAALGECMDEASSALLGGVVIPTTEHIVLPGERYAEKGLWPRVVEIVERLDRSNMCTSPRSPHQP